jgi:ABC-type molybdenum transport system ATPase subunit/photorepair protein PhrA
MSQCQRKHCFGYGRMKFAMRKLSVSLLKPSISLRQYGTSTVRPPIIRISNGTFYRHHPNSHHVATNANQALFENLDFELPSFSAKPEFWAILAPSSAGKTTFLQILRGQHLSVPPAARSYPYLESDEIDLKDHSLRIPSRAIKHVGFDGEQGLVGQAPQSAYLSARYESRREDTDFSVLDYLQGNTELNPSQDIDGKKIDTATLERVIRDLRLGELVDMPVSNLSNGQTRRAKIARALLSHPEVLLLDEPFMGLDPPTLLSLSPMLQGLAEANAPRLVLALRPQDPIPDWITHLMFLRGNCQIAFKGPKDDVLNQLEKYVQDVKDGNIEPDLPMPLLSMHEVGHTITKDGIMEMTPRALAKTKTNAVSGHPQTEAVALSRDGYKIEDTQQPEIGEALVEMEGARVTYGSKSVLGNWKQNVDGSEKDGLWWTVRRGERWGIFGPNGSGKTTILSLICSDHPQTYSLPVRLFGRSRIPEPGQLGISIFDIQARIGHSSPEIHNHIPRSLTLRQVLENAWSDTFRGLPKLDPSASERIDAALRWFEQDLRPGIGAAGKEKQLMLEKALERPLTLDPANSKPPIAAETAIKPTWADELFFGELPFSAQRVALFLRANIKQPDIVILDEAFSGMDDGVRDRCLLFLAHGEEKTFDYTATRDKISSETQKEGRRIIESDISLAGQVKLRGLSKDQALLCISHVREEIPGSIREWICLPEANTGQPARFGRLNGPIEGDYRRWNEIWGM